MFFGDKLPAADAAAHRPGQQGRPRRRAAGRRPASGPGAWPRGPRSIVLTKWLVNRSLDSDRATAFHDEAMAQDLNMTTADAQEGVASFVERRDPDYQGW